MPKKIELIQIDQLPDQDSELPGDVTFYALGCLVCPSLVCFAGLNVTSLRPEHTNDPLGALGIVEILEELGAYTAMHQDMDESTGNVCGGVCLHEADILTAVRKLNRQFNANLDAGQTA
ncbi:MAG TPA: hypothetical protein VLG47_06720 [Candidatus Saccharimonadales bacterium]|nr:hypothetical protein [Candidatus Saccharimonadales bacterium]